MTANPKKDALTSGDLAGAIPDDYVGKVNKNAKFQQGDVAYCRTFDCKARVLTVATTKSGACNYKVALYSKSGQKTGEAVCTEAELVKTATRGMKLTGVVSGASQACTLAANALAAMVQKNKINVPLAQKLIRGIQRDFPEARVQNALSYMRDGNVSGFSTASRILQAESQRLRAQGKSMKAMRASVKRAPASVIPLIAPLQSKMMMLYRKLVATPESVSLGGVPALAAQWKAIAGDLPKEEQSGVRLIVRDLMSAYRAFANQQIKNVAYFLAMALGTANKMVGGSDSVPIPRHLRAMKADSADLAAQSERLLDSVQGRSREPIANFSQGDTFLANANAYTVRRLTDSEVSTVNALTRQTKVFPRFEGMNVNRVQPNELRAAIAIAKQAGGGFLRPSIFGGKSTKAADAKEYFDKHKQIPRGSIFKVNGKIYELERNNGYVLSGFEYKKPWSTNTRAVVDLRNTPVQLLSVGNGTLRTDRNGSLIFGRRPATLNVKRKPPAA